MQLQHRSRSVHYAPISFVNVQSKILRAVANTPAWEQPEMCE